MIELPAPLVLASTSKYRRAQLARLGLPFVCVAPRYDELPVADLDVRALVDHHATQKALAVLATPEHAHCWVLSADQGAILHDGGGPVLLGKPGSTEAAIAQLLRLAGRTHELRTTVALGVRGRPVLARTVVVLVTMRQLTPADAAAYVALDQPLDCAGSYKVEAGGPWVLASCAGDDPTAIEGLPLLAVVELLREALERR